MAEKFRLLVRAKADGFYGDRKHYSLEGKNKGHKRAGQPFAILADALRYDANGNMEVTKDLKPVLPTWVEPLEPVKPIDPKTTPHIVKERKEKPAKRFRPKEVAEVAPMAWPANQKAKGRKLQADDEDIPDVRIKRAGPPGGMQHHGKQEDDED